MTAPTRTPRARACADDEHRRAARAAEIAERHEQRFDDGPVMKAFHLRMATIHRQVQRQHLAAAATHAAHAQPAAPSRDLPATTSRAQAFLTALFDTPDGYFNIDRFLSTFVAECVVLLEVTAAALLHTDTRGKLRAAVCSGDAARLFTDAEIAGGEGPSVQCHSTGSLTAYLTPLALAVHWPHLAGAAEHAGIAAVYAIPLRYRDNAIGVLTLLGDRPGHLRYDALPLARLLGAAATIALINQRTLNQQERTSAQLQTALTSRIAIEQAKGILAERLGIPIDAAFALLRGHARAHNHNLHEVAAEVIEHRLEIIAHR